MYSGGGGGAIMQQDGARCATWEGGPSSKRTSLSNGRRDRDYDGSGPSRTMGDAPSF
jgi:hypothetical protein